MYATGNATTVNALLDAFVSFCVANAGMTLAVDRQETMNDVANIYITGVGYQQSQYRTVCLTKGPSNWWLTYCYDDVRAFISESSFDSGTWHTSGNESYAQNDKQSYVQSLSPITPPFTTYDFFTEGTCVHMAAQMSNGAFTHFSIGDVTKYGSWIGGHYVAITNTASGSNSSYLNNGGMYPQYHLFGNTAYATMTYIYAPNKAGTRTFATFGSTQGQDYNDGYTPAYAFSQNTGVIDTLIANTPNTFNNRATGPRLELFLLDVPPDGTSRLWRPCGYIPNLRPINIRLLNPRDVVNDDWMVFPLQSKNLGVLNTFANTYNYGWAMQK